MKWLFMHNANKSHAQFIQFTHITFPVSYRNTVDQYLSGIP